MYNNGIILLYHYMSELSGFIVNNSVNFNENIAYNIKGLYNETN